jgi:ADP-ribosylation factor-like protein 2
VDATDRLRTEDCREELKGLLLEEVCFLLLVLYFRAHLDPKRLAGAGLLVFSNKTDVNGCMSNEEIREVCRLLLS